MQKIPSLFKRNYEGDRLVYNKVVPGCEWVLAGEGWATQKFDGTACMIRDRKLYKRYDRRPTKGAKRRHVEGEAWQPEDFREAPPDWEACEEAPNLHTGHWPGWMPVGDGPEDKWHHEGYEWLCRVSAPYDGTYELVGPKVQGNPYNLTEHQLIEHRGQGWFSVAGGMGGPPSFERIKAYLKAHAIEGIVFHHQDGRMAKIKRRDFGFRWPPKMED